MTQPVTVHCTILSIVAAAQTAPWVANAVLTDEAKYKYASFALAGLGALVPVPLFVYILIDRRLETPVILTTVGIALISTLGGLALNVAQLTLNKISAASAVNIVSLSVYLLPHALFLFKQSNLWRGQPATELLL